MKKADKLFDLTGRTALITGAGGHLGAPMAAGLADCGARLVLWGRSSDPLERLAEQIRALGGDVMVQQADLSDNEKLDKALCEFKEQFDEVDIIINNAYSGGGGSSEHASVEDFSNAYQIAVTAAFQITQSLRPLLRVAAAKHAGGSSVINISSMYGMVSPDFRVYDSSADANPPFYGAAKAGLIQLTRYMACEFAPEKIRVNSISPGPFPEKKVQAGNPEFCDRLAKKVPMGRIGKPEEIIGPALFLASDAASYVTGTNLAVDGGWTAW
jgi:NAD(P)-dependent dehydrogenase (short-subunit alcohol dehydrogenase family)